MKPQPMPLDGDKTETDVLARNGEVGIRLVHVRRQELDAHVAALAIYSATFVLLSSTLVSSAAIYSRGWWHFIYAVR